MFQVTTSKLKSKSSNLKVSIINGNGTSKIVTVLLINKTD